jgi:pectinesterase
MTIVRKQFDCENNISYGKHTDYSTARAYMKKFDLLIIPLLLCAACGRTHSPRYQAIVDARHAGAPGAASEGAVTFSSIAAALSRVPADNPAPYTIFIRKGRYHEKLSVNRPYVHFVGESRDETVITFDACGETPNPRGETYGTWGCATLIITKADFSAENLTIENGFDYPANAAKADDDLTKVKHAQAVALMIAEGSDRAAFRNCRIAGYQDTLFPNAGRSWFHRCQILGHVDFIFGAGQAVFEACEIVSRDRQGKDPTGYVTAPSTLASYPYGFLFIDCRLLKEKPELAPGSVRLGRSWHPHGNLRASGSTIFIRCYMDDHFGREGYATISSTDSTGRKIEFEVGPDSRFFEYGSYGPGAVASPRRPLLDPEAAGWYTADHLLNGWEP